MNVKNNHRRTHSRKPQLQILISNPFSLPLFSVYFSGQCCPIDFSFLLYTLQGLLLAHRQKSSMLVCEKAFFQKTLLYRYPRAYISSFTSFPFLTSFIFYIYYTRKFKIFQLITKSKSLRHYNLCCNWTDSANVRRIIPNTRCNFSKLFINTAAYIHNCLAASSRI